MVLSHPQHKQLYALLGMFLLILDPLALQPISLRGVIEKAFSECVPLMAGRRTSKLVHSFSTSPA
jgi:hypothetical protein